MALRCVTSEDEFRALEPAWRALFQSNPNHTPYQSWDWNYTWWRLFGEPGRLRLLVDEVDGTLLGIAPLYLARRFRGWPLRHLTFISRGRAEYLDFVVRGGAERDFFRNLFEYLREQAGGWRFLELKDFPDRSANLPFVQEESARAFPVLSRESIEICVSIPLPRAWSDFLALFNKRLRSDVGYDRRFLAKHFTVDFRIVTDPQAAVAAMEDLFAVYRSRWQSEKGATAYDDPRVAKFETDIAQQFARAGLLRLYLLYADQQPVAALLGNVSGGRYFADVFVHSPEFRKYSVGNVLLGMAIEDCIASGITQLDLARGNEPYKYRWNGRAKQNFHLKIFPNRASLALASVADWFYETGSSVGLLHRIRAIYKRARRVAKREPAAPAHPVGASADHSESGAV